MKEELIYDFKEKKVIKAHNINISISNKGGYLAINRNSVEVTMVVKNDNVKWAVNWFDSMYCKQGYSSGTKRNLHIQGFNLMLYNCYLKSYNSIQIGESELIIGCDYHEKNSKNLYKNYYRDSKIDELLS